MPNIPVKYVHSYEDRHGKARCYFRRGSRKAALTAPLGSTEWLSQYHAALIGEPQPVRGVGAERSAAAGTVNAVIDAYFLSRDYRKMGAKTQRGYRAPFEILRTELGTFQVAAVRRRHIVALLDETENDGQNNNLLIAVRKVIGQAIDMELREDDPTLKIEKIASTNPLGRRCWTAADIEQYRRRHPIGTMARLALEIGFNTGLRISDIAVFGRQHLLADGKSFRIIPGKTAKFGTIVAQPIRDPQLIAALAAAPVRGQRAFLCSSTGRDFTADTLGDHFAKWCKAAGLPDACRAHGLRKACAVRLSHASASTHEIMAWIGDRDPKMVELYTKARDTWLLSESGADKLDAIAARV